MENFSGMTVVDRVPEIWPETRLDPDFFFLIKNTHKALTDFVVGYKNLWDDGGGFGPLYGKSPDLTTSFYGSIDGVFGG